MYLQIPFHPLIYSFLLMDQAAGAKINFWNSKYEDNFLNMRLLGAD